MPVLIMVVLLALLGVSSWWWGHDSRDGADWTPRHPLPH
jgi:hypothetical protein